MIVFISILNLKNGSCIYKCQFSVTSNENMFIEDKKSGFIKMKKGKDFKTKKRKKMLFRLSHVPFVCLELTRYEYRKKQQRLTDY